MTTKEAGFPVSRVGLRAYAPDCLRSSAQDLSCLAQEAEVVYVTGPISELETAPQEVRVEEERDKQRLCEEPPAIPYSNLLTTSDARRILSLVI